MLQAQPGTVRELVVMLGHNAENAWLVLGKAFHHTGCTVDSTISDLSVRKISVGHIAFAATISGDYDNYKAYSLTLVHREYLDIDANLMESVCGYGSQVTRCHDTKP